MEIPGMNPLQGRMQVPGQSQPIGPGGPQSNVPDLILDAPGLRTPTEQAPQQAPASTTAPYQAPLQAVVQQVQQQMTAALMEMGLPATQQNQQMAQLLADYGHAVNTQTLGILKQAVSGLPDRSPQTLEAAVILLSKDLPVTEQNVTAIKQFLNGGPLPQQLQNLPQNVVNLLQQMQQSAQATPPTANPASNPQAQLTGANPATPALNPAGNNPAAPGDVAQAPTGTQTVPGGTSQATTISPTPGTTTSTPGTVPGTAANLTANPALVTQTQMQTGQTPNVTPQASQLQTVGGNIAQIAAGSAVIQQAAGQLQAIENRSDGLARLGERSTAEKVSAPDSGLQALKGIESIEGQSTQSTQSAQSRQVSQQMPSAYSKDQESLQQLHLFMHGGEVPAVEQVNPGGKAASLQSPEAVLLQLLRVTLEASRVAGHLAENMQLKDFGQLYIQHQQIIQLTGLLENKLHEFHQLFSKAFPELSQEVQKLLQHESLDTFGKLAKLLDDHQAQIQERLKLPGTADEQFQVLNTLRQLMEQVGVSVEKVQSHMLAREMLTQNMPVHVVPMMVHFKGESFPAEVYIHQDAENEHRPDANGNLPLKITLTLETKNMGRVGVDLLTLKDDMTVDLKVQNRRIKLVIDDAIQQLKHKIEYLGDYKISHLACRVDPELDNRQSMLLPVKRTVRSLRRIEGVV